MKRKHFLVEHVGTILGQAELGASVVNLIGKVEARSRPFYQSQGGGPRGVSPWVNALPAGSGGLLAT